MWKDAFGPTVGGQHAGGGGRAALVPRCAVTLLVGGALVVSAAGCGGGDAATGATGAQSSSATAAHAGGAKNVVDLALGLGFEFQVGLHHSEQQEGTKLGVNVRVVDGQSDQNTWANNAQNAIAERPSAIIFDPVDFSAAVPSIAAANQAGIPAFLTEGPVKGVDVKALVEYDNYKIGETAADEVAKLTGGKGIVLEAMGQLTHPAAQGRHAGFLARIKHYPQITVVSLNAEWDANKALTLTENALTVHPKVAAIYSHNDEMVKGVIAALKQDGKLKPAGEPGHIPVLGIDGTPLALQRIRQGTEDATISQDPIVMGRDIVQDVADYFSGKPFPKLTLLQGKLITKQNVNDPSNWGNIVK